MIKDDGKFHMQRKVDSSLDSLLVHGFNGLQRIETD